MGPVFLLLLVWALPSCPVCSQQVPHAGGGPNAGGFVFQPPVQRRSGSIPGRGPNGLAQVSFLSQRGYLGVHELPGRSGWEGGEGRTRAAGPQGGTALGEGEERDRAEQRNTGQPGLSTLAPSTPRWITMGGPVSHQMFGVPSPAHKMPVPPPPICNQDHPDVAECSRGWGQRTPLENYCVIRRPHPEFSVRIKKTAVF